VRRDQNGDLMFRSQILQAIPDGVPGHGIEYKWGTAVNSNW
jgi:hypothetical protein